MHLLTQLERRFITSPPVKFPDQEKQENSSAGFPGHSLFDVIRFFISAGR